MRLVIVNKSTLVADPDAERVTDAVAEQLRQVASIWGLAHPHVVFAGPAEDGDVEVVLLDDADQAGVLGYHSTTPDGAAYARVFVRDSIAGIAGVDPETLTGDQPSDVVNRCVAPVVSHEAIETLIDAGAAEWIEDANGTLWALEACDPCESSSYPIVVDDQDVFVSNFVHPSFFNVATPAGAVVDEMAVLAAGPFTIAADGYAIRQHDGAPLPWYGADLAPWRVEQHEQSFAAADAFASRTAKRVAAFQAPASDDAQPAEEPGGDVLPEDPDPDGVEQADDLDDVGMFTMEVDDEVAAAILRHPTNRAVIQDNVSVPGAQITGHLVSGEMTVHVHDHDAVRAQRAPVADEADDAEPVVDDEATLSETTPA